MLITKKYCLSVVLLCVSILLAGCGSITGLPGHGGGKRFALEQEMLSVVIKDAVEPFVFPVDFQEASTVFNIINDEGSGELSGGRLEGLLRGTYGATREAIRRSGTPESPVSDGSFLTSTIIKGDAERSQFVLSSSSASGNDRAYLMSLVNAVVTQKGIKVANLFPEPTDEESKRKKAEEQCNKEGIVDKGSDTRDCEDRKLAQSPLDSKKKIYFNVTVLGLHRDRMDYIFYNREQMKVRCMMEMMLFDENDRVVSVNVKGKDLNVQTSGAEAVYAENYVLWSGPVAVRKTVDKYGVAFYPDN
ncbi:MAG: hypothetical protein H7836_08595 [Magnetococcus sp. YQC-3]